MSDEEDYDVFNNETFGEEIEEFDWEADHDHISRIIQLEKSREDAFSDGTETGEEQDCDNEFADLLREADVSHFQQDEYVLFPSHEKNIPLPSFDSVYSKIFPNNAENSYELSDKLEEEMRNNLLLQDSHFFPISNLDACWKTSTLSYSKNNQQTNCDLTNGNLIDFDLTKDEWFTRTNGTSDSDTQDETAKSGQLTPPLLKEFPLSKPIHVLRRPPQTDYTNRAIHPPPGVLSQPYNPSTTNQERTLPESIVQLLSQPESQNTQQNISPSTFPQLFFGQVKSSLSSDSSNTLSSVPSSNSEKNQRAPKDESPRECEDVTKESKNVLTPINKRTAAFLIFPPSQIYHPRIFDHLKKMESVVSLNFLQDEYSGLMTEREKYWLAGIQLLPFNNMQPYRDDYYFTMYQLRHSTKRKNPITIKDSVRKNQVAFKDYSPLQFENSLGKVQVGSTVAPRKVIDTYNIKHTVVKNYSQDNENPSQRAKTILLKIEDIYSRVLSFEDLQYVIPKLKDREQTGEQEEIIIKCRSLLLEVYKELMASKTDFLKYMSIRKGKRLILRYLPYCDKQFFIWTSIFEFISEIIKHDKGDGVLLFYLPNFRNWLSSVLLSTLIQIAEHLTYSLDIVLQDKFGVSVLANMIEHAEFIFATGNKNEQMLWMNFIGYLAQQLMNCHLVVEKPVVCLKEETLLNHLSRCKRFKNGYVANLVRLFTNLVIK